MLRDLPSRTWHDSRVIRYNQKSVFKQLAATFICCNTLITGLNEGGKTRIIAFNTFCGNVANQVARFCCRFTVASSKDVFERHIDRKWVRAYFDIPWRYHIWITKCIYSDEDDLLKNVGQTTGQKVHLRLTCVARRRLCLSSLIPIRYNGCNKHLLSGPSVNNYSCFPSDIEIPGKKLTVSWGTSL